MAAAAVAAVMLMLPLPAFDSWGRWKGNDEPRLCPG